MNQHDLFQTICLLLIVIATQAIGRDYLLLHRVRLAESMAGGNQKEQSIP
jgi:hypothetical protein